jgi:type III pantothenate kinase
MDKYYETMGIDRVIACEAVNNAVVLDAGSAVTVDVVKDSKYHGGFIYPGKKAMQKTYSDISSALSYSFNFEVSLDKMPKNSQDSISYGYLKTLYSEVMSHNMDIILTGGDAENFAHIFPDAKIDKKLIFNGMSKIIKKANIC